MAANVARPICYCQRPTPSPTELHRCKRVFCCKAFLRSSIHHGGEHTLSHTAKACFSTRRATQPFDRGGGVKLSAFTRAYLAQHHRQCRPSALAAVCGS